MTQKPGGAAEAYVGSELELFHDALVWKRYLARFLRGAIAGEVLEVGAGIGGTTRVLCNASLRRWLALEPDPALGERIEAERRRASFPCRVDVVVGTLADLPAMERFDTILYIDVLEHIADDHAELSRAAERLRPGGRLIVAAPAHAWLYSEFDRAIGHHRRYTAKDLRRLTPAELTLCRICYLDSVGTLASLSNRLLLRQPNPSRRQIEFWDRFLVPLSRLLDPLLRYHFGKTVVAIWSAPAAVHDV